VRRRWLATSWRLPSYLLYDRQHRACEALGLGLTGRATAAANGIEVGLPSFGRDRNPFRTLPKGGKERPRLRMG